MLPPGEASKGEKKEHNLYFGFAFLGEPNYVIFVKASLLFSYCQPLSHLLYPMVQRLSLRAAYLGGNLVAVF